ncbi:hypothetical protein CKY28_02940 [Sphingomonas lenta]|uniref:ABC-type transport auxiliary lipoprotein component domain-containing protein n=1 Tax=Sphingomonas lenta TaxID=1141887 RepID=A0A2A2SL05_9SPHN|nr:hypothetical protein CKY28_02940 [Sphingomonas lenta]
MVAVSLAILSSGAAAAQTSTSYVVAPIRSELSGSDTVGALRSGLICAPAGKLRWSDVAHDPARAARLVATTLGERGVRADMPADDRIGSPPVGERRIVGDVIRLEASACLKQYGLLRKLSPKRSMSGRGEIAIRWRVHRTGVREPEATYVTCADFALNGDARQPDALLDQGIAAAARDFGDLLTGKPASPRCEEATAS